MPVVTNNDRSHVVIRNPQFLDDVLTVPDGPTPGEPVTVPAGTILARNSVTRQLVPYVKGSTDEGAGIPLAVTTYELTDVVPGNVPLRVLVGGEVDADLLVIFADLDASNLDTAELDGLRGFGIFAEPVAELSSFDNQ